MDSIHKDTDAERNKNYNTEYLPTKCRVTKPPPPKPATNPLQFVKVAPCPLFQKAQEQIKKVEEIKIMRKEVHEEAEDWQQNLDNWKSSRRKRQEHIIERVVEVKKLEQEETQRSRRKNKTFSEMMEERSRGRHKFNIPIYNDDDANDLSDYGIGSSSSKTNSIKDVDTDDNSSVLDEKDMKDFDFNKDNSSTSNQSQSEDETNTKPIINKKDSRPLDFSKDYTNESLQSNQVKPNIYTSNMYTNLIKSSYMPIKSPIRTSYDSLLNSTSATDINLLEKPQYTYEGAIQDYRTRIRSKINIDESIFNKPYECKSKDSDVQNLVPKGNIFKRKEIFEIENRNDTNLETSRRLSEDFANTQSIKERLQSLEKCTDQALKNADKKINQIGSLKTRLQNFNKQNEADTKNNNNNSTKSPTIDMPNNNKISHYLLDKSNSTSKFETKRNPIEEWKSKEIFDRPSSPETEMYMNKLNMFNRDLDNLMYGKSIHSIDSDLEDFVGSSNYPASTSSTEVMAMSSDRDDSGIHTADVSCSVSQADEPFEDADLSSTIPICIEKLTIVKENESQEDEERTEDPNKEIEPKDSLDNVNSIECQSNDSKPTDLSNNNFNLSEVFDINYLKETTEDFLDYERKDCSYNMEELPVLETSDEVIEEIPIEDENVEETDSPEDETMKSIDLIDLSDPPFQSTDSALNNDKIDRKPVIYENVKISPYENIEIRNPDVSFPMEFITGDIFGNPIVPGKLEPPKVKPPPPPPQDVYDGEGNFKRMNSTKRIKKEIQIKRSSFLGLSEPTDDQIDPEVSIDKPPDINSFLQKESRMEKSMYKKLQGSREGGFSEVESQDSGLEIERGRLSSDTWCSSLIDSSTPIHERQDSEQTNSFTSEEDEITKKEREIIELVEKEEKSRDSDYSSQTTLSPVNNKHDDISSYENNLGSDKFDRPYYSTRSGYGNNLDTADSEVLRVEHELLQLEREEMERQRENLLFGNCSKIRQNRHSLENICDVDGYSGYGDNMGYRKSMPELQRIPIEYRKSLPDVPNYKAAPEVDFQYRKSMPDIQHAYNRSITDYRNNVGPPDTRSRLIDYRKSMPELQQEMPRTGFRSPPPIIRQQPIIPAKPLRVITKDQDKDRLNSEPELIQPTNKHIRPLTRHSLHVLSAVPRPRHLPNDNWIHPKPNNEAKNYNQHWLYQEAEFRRISEQENAAALQNRNWQPRADKHIPDSVIQSLTQRVQNRGVINDRSPQILRNIRPENSPSKEYTQHPYLGHHPQTLGHALPLSHPPTVQIEDTQDKMLSVSGKKKCSNCGNELGRGAAMIIESLCLFYHMECFKCCVCHMRLGDGLMGTDVRVRNQKLHCHNCYSSEDGIKFSCV